MTEIHFASKRDPERVNLTIIGTDPVTGRYVGTITMQHAKHDPVSLGAHGYAITFAAPDLTLRFQRDIESDELIPYRVLRQIASQETVSEVFGRAGQSVDPAVVNDVLRHFHEAARKTRGDSSLLPSEAVEIFQACLAALIELCGGGKVNTAQEDREQS